MNKLKIGHLPGFKPPTVPNTKREKAWQAWQEEVRRRPVPGRHSGEAMCQWLVENYSAVLKTQRFIDVGLKETALRYLAPEALAEMPKELGASFKWLKAIDGAQYGLDFVEIDVPAQAVIIQLERSSGLFTAQYDSSAEAQRIVDGLRVYRGYTPEEIAANEGIFWDYALALRRLEDEAEMRRYVE